MAGGQDDDSYPPEEADRRRDDALRRALNRPAAPQGAMKGGRRELARPIGTTQKKPEVEKTSRS